MDAKDKSIPFLQIIQNIESELESLTEKQEELCDKGQTVFYIAQKISQKRLELDSMKNFLQKRQKTV